MMSGDVTHVLPLTAATATEVAQAGGKGAMLARLAQAGLPVPAGCVLTPQALTTYLEAQGRSATSETGDQMLRDGAPPAALQHELHMALDQLGAAASGWAVRSSAVAEDSAAASFAGVYESFLKIPDTDIWDAVRSCWLSWGSERAQAYRQRLGDTGSTPAMAVVIQQMVPARSVGVAFTADPISGDRTRMVINASPGLGVAVVSGVIEPEQYTLTKTPDIQVVETRLLHPEQPPLLAPEMVATLGELLLRIETLCGSPQDVEWAWDGEQYWIVQSRPITTLGQPATEDEPDIWTHANLKEVLPGLISPLSWSLVHNLLESGIREQYARLGFTWPSERLTIRRFWGRAYFNMALFQQAGYEVFGAPPEETVTSLGGPAVLGFTPGQPPSLWQRLRWLYNTVRVVWFLNRCRKQAPTQFARIEQRWREERQQIPHFGRETLIHALATREATDQPFLVFHLDLTAAMNGHFTLLRQLIARHLPNAPAGMAAELVTGLGDVHSADHSYDLWKLSRLARQSPEVMAFLASREWPAWREALANTPLANSWQAFLDTYGHRGLYEVDMANPRWREQPDYLFDILASYAAIEQEAPPFDPQQQAQRRQAAEADALQQMPRLLRGWFRTTLRRAQVFSRLREQCKSHVVRFIDLSRQLALRAGDLLVQDGVIATPETVFLLERDEVLAALRGEMPAPDVSRRLEQRRVERQRYAAMQPPEAFVGDRPLYDATPRPDGTVLSGLSSSPGRVTGVARVIRTPQEGRRLQPGEILVAPSTDPGWTPLFLLAAGLVMETGGYLSHGAIVAREYGIPAVLNVPLATQRIPDGATVMLDGGAGTVKIAECGMRNAEW